MTSSIDFVYGNKKVSRQDQYVYRESDIGSFLSSNRDCYVSLVDKCGQYKKKIEKQVLELIYEKERVLEHNINEENKD